MAPKKSKLFSTPAKSAKTIKAAAKQTQKQGRQIKRTAKTLSKVVKRVAKKITTQTNSSKKRVVKKSTPNDEHKRSTRKASSVSPPAEVHTETRGLAQWDTSRFKTPASWFNSVKRNYKKINALLKPGDRFAATYMSGETMDMFGDIRDLIKRLEDYELSRKVRDDDGELGRELLDSIKIIYVSGGRQGAIDRTAELKAFREKRAMEDAEVLGEARRAVGSRDEVTGKPKRTVDILKDVLNTKKEADIERAAAEKRAIAAEKRLSALERKMAAFMKQVSKPSKAKKSASKKAPKKASKNTVKKALPKKSVKKVSKPNAAKGKTTNARPSKATHPKNGATVKRSGARVASKQSKKSATKRASTARHGSTKVVKKSVAKKATKKRR